MGLRGYLLAPGWPSTGVVHNPVHHRPGLPESAKSAPRLAASSPSPACWWRNWCRSSRLLPMPSAYTLKITWLATPRLVHSSRSTKAAARSDCQQAQDRLVLVSQQWASQHCGLHLATCGQPSMVWPSAVSSAAGTVQHWPGQSLCWPGQQPGLTPGCVVLWQGLLCQQQMDFSPSGVSRYPFWMLFSLCRPRTASSASSSLPVPLLLSLLLELRRMTEGLDCLHLGAAWMQCWRELVPTIGVPRGAQCVRCSCIGWAVS